MASSTTEGRLKRELGVFGAVMMGLGSIVGTGVFVSIAIAAGIAGPMVILATAIGATVATANGLSSAQLAANHPVSGGTYEYGYRYLNSWLGFIAGWTFLLAKSASAATAALGFAGYLLVAIGLDNPGLAVPLALGAVIVLTVIVLSGIRRSNTTNIVIVSITLLTLLAFVMFGLSPTFSSASETLQPFFVVGPDSDRSLIPSLLYASALMFVAYTGYGRIATLGEEVREPRQTIPRAIITTLVFTMILYGGVATVAVGAAGAEVLSNTVTGRAAPLEIIAQGFGVPILPQVMAFGAITAMLGVLLNLILGLSRVLLAMGRRRDMPAATAQLNQAETTPWVAVIVMGSVIAGLVLIGDVRTTWSFSAFTVLIYYSITNLAALQLSNEERLFPRWVSIFGLAACLFLAFWVEPTIWLVGLGLIAVGLLWHFVAQRWSQRNEDEPQKE
ncbi:MAG: amino acid permease [Chloroflexi bacterium]|nr:amino acid permease [Chloroflexota bacterium]